MSKKLVSITSGNRRSHASTYRNDKPGLVACESSADRDRVRVYDWNGTLRHLVTPEKAQLLLSTGAFRPKRRQRRLRGLVPIDTQLAVAAQMIADLDRVVYDNGRTIRAGYSHRLDTDDNPRGVVTISRIPTSIRQIFTAVVEECVA